MSEPRERDLVQAVRAELAAIDPPRACCRAAERAALGAAAHGRARSPVVARLAVRLAEGEGLDDFRAEGQAAGRVGPGRQGAGPQGAHRPSVESRGAESPGLDWSAARSHCRAAWLRGRFLAAGSLSLGARGAHLELVVPLEAAEILSGRLEDVGFAAPRRVRRGRAVVTWKRTDTILAFLRFCGASASVLEIESRLVLRQLQGHLNRVLNAENANLERTVASSARQLAMIESLELSGRLGELPEADRAVARGRREAPEASFTELAARLSLSRARVQRAFRRLESEAIAAALGSDL